MPSSPLRVLVVEDLEVNQIVLSSLLAGHGVRFAGSGEEALGLLDTEAFDGALIDLRLPGMDGVETCRRIRRLPKPAKAALPVIAMTGNRETMPQAELAKVLFDDLLVRPFGREQVLAPLSRLTDGSIDRRHLADVLCGLSPERRSALVSAAVAAVSQGFDGLTAALAAGRSETIAADAHRLSSAAGMCGLIGVRGLAQQMEGAARQGDLAPCPALHARLHAILSDDIALFTRTVGSLSAGLA